MHIKTRKGFSTVELMIAFALMSIVFGGVVLAHFGSAYWVIASQTSNEGLYQAKTQLEILRAASKKEFTLASSSPQARINDSSCSSGGLCYYLTTTVDELSPCSKYATAGIAWQVQNYPTTTTSLFTNLTDSGEAVNLGGDCPLSAPPGLWNSMHASSTYPSSVSGNPTALDEFDNLVYAGTDAPPYLSILSPTGAISFANGFTLLEPVNDIDVARDISTGRVYAYLAMASTTAQFAVVDLTDPTKPVLVSKSGLSQVAGVAGSEGWRLRVYGQTVYLTTRLLTSKPELHIFNVTTEANPTEYSSPLDVGTSIYSFVVRDQLIGGTTRRFLYAADTLDNGEVKILDVTSPTAPSVLQTIDLSDAGCGLSDMPDGNAIFVAGNTLVVGREHSNSSCPSLPDLYTFNISDPTNVPSAPLSTRTVNNGSNGSIIGLRVIGELLYVLTSNVVSPTQSNLLDSNSTDLFVGKNSTKNLQVWSFNSGMLGNSASATLTPSNPVTAVESN